MVKAGTVRLIFSKVNQTFPAGGQKTGCLGKCDKIGSRLGSAGDHWLDLGEGGAGICAGTILQGGNAERFAQDTLKSLSRCPAFSSLNNSSQSPICSLSMKICGTV